MEGFTCPSTPLAVPRHGQRLVQTLCRPFNAEISLFGDFPALRTVCLTFASGIAVELLAPFPCWPAILIPLTSALLAHASYSGE